MNWHTMKILVLTEACLRLRRVSTLVTLFVVAALGWWIFADQTSGFAFIVVQDVRVLNTSSTIALGSVALFALIFGLAGFFLTRGRIDEDMRCGTASVIASSTISNSLFLNCRWLGGIGYLIVMAGVFMVTMMVCHLFRGIGPIQPWVYIQTYCIILLPVIFFSVSCAVLFDSFAPLMGKVGDVLFFMLWAAQFSVMGLIDDHAGVRFSPLFLIDFSGVVMTVKSLFEHFHTTDISLGYASFNQALPGITLTDELWTLPMLLMRLASMAIASAVLLPAFLIFHRYSSDKVKVSQSGQRRLPVAALNQWLRPLSKITQPLFGLSARLPGVGGAMLADVALTLSTSPIAILALAAVLVASVAVKIALLPSVLMGAVAVWGITISDISTRDFISGCEQMTGALAGGISQRYLRQSAAAFFLGLLFVGIAGLRLISLHPVQVVAMLVGLASLSALASLAGRTARTPRLYLALFLFWIYIAVQMPGEAVMDIVGFNGAANITSIIIQLSIAIMALICGYTYNRWAR